MIVFICVIRVHNQVKVKVIKYFLRTFYLIITPEWAIFWDTFTLVLLMNGDRSKGVHLIASVSIYSEKMYILRIFFTKSKYPTFRQKNSMHNQVGPQGWFPKCMLHTATN